MGAKDKVNNLRRLKKKSLNELDNIDKMVEELSVEELSQVFKDRPDLVCLAMEYLYFA